MILMEKETLKTVLSLNLVSFTFPSKINSCKFSETTSLKILSVFSVWALSGEVVLRLIRILI